MSDSDDDIATTAWLQRRVAFGFAPGELDARDGVAPEDHVAGLLAGAGLDGDGRELDPPAGGWPDPWDDEEYLADVEDRERRRLATQAISAWLGHMADTPHALREWMAWFWHGHFVSALGKVRHPYLMIQQMRLLRDRGLGSLEDLLVAVTTDGAMLVYLDGVTSQAAAPNENYARELLELFTLGIGNYTETDVANGAAALTGWVLRPRAGVYTGRLAPRRHDDTARPFLGAAVSDVGSVVDAVLSHPACATFITTRLCAAVWGPGVGLDHVDGLASDLRDGDDLGRLLARVLGLAVERPELRAAMVDSPVTWSVAAERACATRLEVRQRLSGLEQAGQLPWNAPSVAGWPGGAAWLTSSAIVGRFNHAAQIAAAADGEIVDVATAVDLARLARLLNRPEGFTEATSAALAGVGSGRPTELLSIALTSPELMVA